MAKASPAPAAPEATEAPEAPVPTIQDILEAARAEGKNAFLVSENAVRVDA